MIDPTSIALGMVGKYNQRMENEQRELQSAFSYVQNLKPEFENGKLTLHIDRKTTFVTMENYLKKRFAITEGGITASLSYHEEPIENMDYDAVFRLPERNIFLKLVPEGMSAIEYANSQMEKARLANPSELWLLTLSKEALDIPLGPVFLESKILRGRIRTLELADVFSEVVGKRYEVSLIKDGNAGFKLFASKKKV